MVINIKEISSKNFIRAFSLFFGLILPSVTSHLTINFCKISDFYFLQKCTKDEDIFTAIKVNVVPVAFALDDGYTIQTVIAMTSICINTKNTTFNKIYVMIPDEFSEKNKNRLLKISELYPLQCQVIIIKMKDKIKMKTIITKRFPLPAYYRLKLPSLLKEYNRVIYLDGDTLTFVDLMEMYNLDLGNNYLLGFSCMYIKDVRRFYKDAKVYINSGVLLMNLYLMRKDNLEEKFKKFADECQLKLEYPDQTILNAVCIGKIDLLPPKWGMFNHEKIDSVIYRVRESQKNNQTTYSENEVIEAFKKPSILHYNRIPKPWQVKLTKGGRRMQIYFEYANKSSVRSEFLALQDKNYRELIEKQKKQKKRKKRIVQEKKSKR